MKDASDDLARLEAMTDAEALQNALDDPDNPPTDAAFWANATFVEPSSPPVNPCLDHRANLPYIGNAVKSRELLRRLATLGVKIEPARGKGGHCLLRYGDNKAPLSVHGDTDLGPVFIKMLCKQLGIDPKEF